MPTRLATTADVGVLSRSLARAFDDDPVMQWVLPDDERRRARLPDFFDLVLRHLHLPHDAVYVTEDLAAGALWDPPGQWRTPVRTQLRLLPTLVRIVGARRAFTVLRGLATVEQVHPKEPHWYLAVLGTDPASQGRGFGAAVLDPVLARCDGEGLPAYLESSKERNVPYYRRFGFEVTGEVRLPDGPPVWTMWREPGAAGG